jgi:alanine racemase
MKTSPMRSWAEISGTALHHNLRTLRRAVPCDSQIIAVVKANAYGHGMLPVAAECVREGVEWLAVANATEGVALRRHRIRRPVLVLGALLREEMELAIKDNLVVTLSSLEEARRFETVARRLRRKVRAHFKIDTGMSRLGVWHDEAGAVIERVAALPHIQLEGLYTHFASAGEDDVMTRRQWRSFTKFRKLFPRLYMHAANSDAILPRQPFAADGVRPGLSLYGMAATSRARALLKPVLTWKSRIVHLHRATSGRTVSYGATYRVRKAETLATVSVGYADGYRRSLFQRASVLVGGRRCPVRGRVTMDMIVVDVSRVPHVQFGDEVVLIGQQGSEEITAYEMAVWAGTISYEIFTGIGSRVVRTYPGFKSAFFP